MSVWTEIGMPACVKRAALFFCAVCLIPSAIAAPATLTFESLVTESRTTFGHSYPFGPLEVQPTGSYRWECALPPCHSYAGANTASFVTPIPPPIPRLRLPLVYPPNSPVPEDYWVAPFASTSVAAEVGAEYTAASANGAVRYSFAIDGADGLSVPVRVQYLLDVFIQAQNMAVGWVGAEAKIRMTDGASTLIDDVIFCGIDSCEVTGRSFDGEFLLRTNVSYDISLNSSAVSANQWVDGRGFMVRATADSQAAAFADPYFEIDPDFAARNGVSLRFSAGVHNVPPAAASVSVPPTLSLMCVTLMAAGAFRRSARA